MTSRISIVAKPTTNDSKLWRSYWESLNQHWRTEQEIPSERQAELNNHRHLILDIDKGTTPWEGSKLNRADIEWLLATHESRGFSGPVDYSDFRQSRREGVNLLGADLTGANLRGLPMTGVQGGLFGDDWFRATPEQRSSLAACFESCDLRYARLENAKLSFASFSDSNLAETHLEGADLFGASFIHSNLELVYFDQETKIENAQLSDRYGLGPYLADIHFASVNLGTVDWGKVKVFGEELQARGKGYYSGYETEKEDLLILLRRAVRAYRSVAQALRVQGLNEDADRFAYRAQLCQRRVFRRQRKLAQYFGSWFLAIVAGYGYRPIRSLISYIMINALYTLLYLYNSLLTTPHLSWNEALVLSISSFHGRGFFSSSIGLGDTYAEIAASEAFVGLLLEVSFIATFTQRFFSK